MANYSQDNRVFKVDTPLGPDVLMLKGFRGEAEVSHPFRLALDLVSSREDVDPTQLLRQPMTVRVELPGGSGERVIHGIVNRFRQLGQAEELTDYEAELVPWLWFLTLSHDCKIFQNMSVQAIASAVFDELGYPDYDFRLTRSYGERGYCVQYRESHFNFVSRLFEEEGLFYFFEHAEDRHLLVISDDNSAFEPLPGQKVAYMASDSSGGEGDDVVTDLRAEHAILTGRATLSDFDFTKPNVSLRTATIGEDGEELYDYPGGYEVVKNGETYAEQIVDEHQARTQQVLGVGKVRALQTGYRLAIDEHYRRDLNQEYVILSMSEQGDSGDFRSRGASAHYSNQFVAIPWDSSFRPARRTRRPVVSGTQTAVVVGPSGDEIYTDEHGRVKVQFHWDRLGKNDENSSCWVRVSYAWAGEGWGAIHIPRIGQEVIVEFLEGDPDRPIVTGRVFNGKQPVPYDLPANKTQSGLKSRSSKGGAAANFNEIRMEDMKGSELLYVHAEKDKQVVVENDRTESVGNDETIDIGHDRTEAVGNDETITIGVNRTETVGSDETITIGSNRTEDVGKNESISVGANRTVTVGQNESITVGANQEVTVGKSLSVTVGADATISIGKDLEEAVGGKHQESVAKEYVLQAKKIQLVATDEISMKTGKATIVMKKNGDVTIKGKKITIKGSGDVVVKGSKIAQN